jgi:hypothetical protein
MNKPAFIYVLTDPNTGLVRYVGKTDYPEKRYRNHIHNSALAIKSHRTRWLKSLIEAGKKPLMIVIEQTSQEMWKQRECWWIAYYRGLGASLVNLAEGGTGGVRSEWITDEMRRNMSLAQIGKVRDRDAIERMAAKNRGKPRAPETIAKMSAANKGKKPSPQCIEAQRKALTGKKHSKELVERRTKHMPGNKFAKRHDYVAIYNNCVAFEVENLTEFCKEHDLNQARMRELAAGDPKRKQHKGWTCKRV